MRKLCVFGVAMAAALTVSDAPHAQTPGENQRVWTGTWEEHDSWEGSSEFGHSQAEISFVYTEGRDEFGSRRWDSRRLTWRARWEETRFDQQVLGKFGEADDRGFHKNRYPADIITVCDGGGTLELGPSAHNELTREQQEQMRPDCVTTTHPRDSTPAPPANLSKRDALPAPSLPDEYELTGCGYEKTWLFGTRGAGSMSVSVSAPVTAVVEVDPDPNGTYGSFVPVPGETLTFHASVPVGTARFRFELDPQATSAFPGYATNATVDDMFFAKYNLGHLRGRYANDGPDMIFDGEHFGGQEWSRIEPLVVETRMAQGGAVVTITAVDYGAVGKLRAFAKSEDCGDWLPIPIRVGTETRDALTIPLDKDNNLIADALEAYRGIDSAADDDSEPQGNGMAGDGLTAFDEYRGFMIRGATCPVLGAPPPVDPEAPLPEPFPDEPATFPGWGDEHIRTKPHHKDLFVHTLDPELGLMVGQFAWASGLSVHLICEPHYVDNDTRIINFTLQHSEFRQWRGKQLTHAEPQHGVHVAAVDFPPSGGVGVALQAEWNSELMGPPKFTLAVLVYKPPRRSDRIGAGVVFSNLNEILVHELLHAVGVPHHADRVENWRTVLGKLNVTPAFSPLQRDGGSPEGMMPAASLGALLILGGTNCKEPLYRNGQFTGCSALILARRGQQNSGDFTCPLRYVGADYYEAPGSDAAFKWTGVVSTGPDPASSESLNVDAWEGSLRDYQNDLEREGTGKLCVSTRGTEINALPGDKNHAGDVGRDKPCAEYLVVNDYAARGVR